MARVAGASRCDQLGEVSLDLISAMIHLGLRVWVLDAAHPVNRAPGLHDKVTVVSRQIEQIATGGRHPAETGNSASDY